jgi:hypothetical protein
VYQDDACQREAAYGVNHLNALGNSAIQGMNPQLGMSGEVPSISG